MENRINLFKKASQKIIKQQELNCKVFAKIEAARDQSPFLRRISSRKENRIQSSIKHKNTHDHQVSSESLALADKLYQQRL